METLFEMLIEIDKMYIVNVTSGNFFLLVVFSKRC